jgi:CheY-like chemotaxis protein
MSAQHILVVDDDPGFAKAIGAVLREAGFRVTTSSHFGSALSVLEGNDPIHLLLADIAMPGGVNGVALSRMGRMRRPDLRVVYLTGYDIAGVENEALGPVLRKPVDNDALVRVIKEALVSPRGC